MINNLDNENILDTNVGRAIAGAITNKFEKKVCANCAKCAPKGAIKYYCGYDRRPVEGTAGCDRFKEKL